MTQQYIRYLAIDIDGERFMEPQQHHMLRTVFSVEVMPYNSMSFADIRIFNLSADTVVENGSNIVLSAGYRDNFDVIFVGTVINSFKERDGVDGVTRLLCRSSSIAQRGSISSSYGPGSKLTDVLLDLARGWPAKLDIDLTQFKDEPEFISGYSINGDIPSELDSLGKRFGFSWIPERGAIVISRDGIERNTEVIEISKNTGMVGYPEVNRGDQGLGVYVVSRINPAIRSSSRINVISKYTTYNTGNVFVNEVGGDVSANGEYNVLWLRYEGDTHGDEWNVEIDALRPGTAPEVELVSSEELENDTANGKLVWGARVSQDFRNKVREIAKRLRFNPNHLMAVMAFETGATFSPSIRNAAGSGAVGLIQFMPNTASGLGTSSDKLAGMTAEQQLDMVEKYLEPYSGRMRSITDMYMAVLYPAAVGKADDFVVFKSPSVAYTQNAGLDVNRDGEITKKEATAQVIRMYNLGIKNAQ